MTRLSIRVPALTTLKKMFFTLLCCTVLMVFAAPAQTVHQIKADPGTNNPPPPGAILDLANPPQPIPGGGNGSYQQYTVNFTATSPNTAITFAFRDDPAFISLANASVFDTTVESSNLLVNGDFSQGFYANNGNDFTPNGWTYANVFGATFGGIVIPNPGSEIPNCNFGDFIVNNCWYDGAVQAYDAITQTIATNVGDNYQITFSVAEDSFCGECSFSELSTNGNEIDTGGNGKNVAVYAQAGLPAQKGDPITQDGGGLNQTFFQNNNAGQVVAATFDFTPAFAAGNLVVAPGTTPFVDFHGITQAQYQALVAGTAMAGTSCLKALGLTDASGNPLCVVNSVTATTDADPVPSGKNLPQDTSPPNTREILFSQILDLDPNQGGPVMTGQIIIPANTAPGLAEFNDSGTCPYPDGDPLFGKECPRSILTSIIDGHTKPAGTPQPAGLGQVFFCCEPEWTTVPTIQLWTNTPSSIPVLFQSTPPLIPNPNPTGFHPAQGLGVSFGAVAQGVVLDPALSFPTEQTALNLTQPTGCPNSTDWTQQNPIAYSASGMLSQFDNNGTPASFGEGAYSLLYAPLDCDEFLGLKYPPSIDITSLTENPNNLAQWNTVPFNVDLTKPTVSPITLNPPGGVYAQGSSPKASFTCSDPVSNGVASGIATCGPNAGGGALTVAINNATVSTATVGPNTFTAGATDVAGNSATTPSSVNYQVVGPADLAIGMIASPFVRTGTYLTYLIGVANKGPNSAAAVVVTDTLPAPNTFVSAGFALESCNLGNGRPICSISPPTTSCGATPGICNIGALPAWTKNNPIGVLIQITVQVNAKANTKITNTVVASETNTDPNLNNNTAPWTTLVTK